MIRYRLGNDSQVSGSNGRRGITLRSACMGSGKFRGERPPLQGSLRPAVEPFHAAVPHTTPELETVRKTELESSWKVVVLNDPVNLMSYVVLVFKKVFGFDETRARRHMLEVHEQGRSVVWTGSRERAETYVYTLQEWHLSAILERDEQD